MAEYVAQQQDEQTHALVEQLLLAEREGRRRARLGKLVQQAGFPHLKTFDGYTREHISFPAGCTVEGLLDMSWLRQRENLLLMGAVGTGKTHMATALGIEACRRGMRFNSFGLPIWFPCRKSLRQARSADFARR